MVHGYPDYLDARSPQSLKLGEVDFRLMVDNVTVNAGGTRQNTLDLSTTGKKWRLSRVFLLEESNNRPMEFEFTDETFGVPILVFSGGLDAQFPELESELNPTIAYDLTNNHSSETAFVSVLIVLVEVV